MEEYKKEIKNMLGKILPEETAEQIFEANFPKPIKGYKPGKILNFKELKELSEGSIIHIYYLDDDGEVSEDGFHPLNKHSEEEWSAGSVHPFPINKLKDDTLIQNIDNCDWSFTIREAILDKKYDHETTKQKRTTIQELLEELTDLAGEFTNDKDRKKAIKTREKEIQKQLKKLKFF